MDRLQASLATTMNQASEFVHEKQHNLENFIHDTNEQLEKVKSLDFKDIAITEAKTLNHELKDHTGLDLGDIVPELKEVEIDSEAADAEDAAYFAALNKKGKQPCVRYEETIPDKAYRLSGYFQDWRGY